MNVSSIKEICIVIALPTLRQLQFFSALVKRQSFSKAAGDCFVSQSTLSSGIKELENILGAQLIDRSTKSFALTAAGHLAVGKGMEILVLAEDLARNTKDKKPLVGKFRLGVIPTIAPFLLPSAVPQISKNFPELSLFLQEGLTEVLLVDLRQGKLDGALLALPYDLSGLEVVDICDDPFVLATSRRHTLSKCDEINVDSLEALDLLLLDDGHCLRDHALDVCSIPRGNNTSEFGATSLYTLAPMVAAGLGVTLLPKMSVKSGFAETFNLATAALQGLPSGRKIGIAFRSGAGVEKDVQLLADLFKEVASS